MKSKNSKLGFDTILNGKKVLFFSVQTFNLEKEICKALERAGAVVTYYDERPSNTVFSKGIIRLKRSVYQKRINSYYSKILNKTQKINFDYLFVNRGEVITAEFLTEFKKQQPHCKMFFYTWDSFTNHTHPTTILHLFDKRFTFDLEDAVKYNIGFRPLFYLNQFKEVKSTSKQHKLYDLLFLGTAHSDRYRISNSIKNWCSSKGLKAYCYYYIQNKSVYFFKKWFDKGFEKFDYKQLSFKSLSTSEIIELYKNANVILDINHPGQKGLTMRTFEAIGAGKKLITTNKEIRKYPFFHPQMMHVIDRNSIDLNVEFFTTTQVDLEKDLYNSCSIDGWLNEIFQSEECDDWRLKMNDL